VRAGEPAEARSFRLRDDRSGFDEEAVAAGAPSARPSKEPLP
jgi:hypothetical protein